MSDILNKTKNAIIEGEVEKIEDYVKETLENEINDPLRIIHEILNPALKEVGDQFDKGDKFLPQLILSADAMENAINFLNPHLESEQQKIEKSGRVVMATVQGDVHDIGKNIVNSLLRANGFEVLDLGKDVNASRIINEAINFNADIIGLSALLSTTIPYCRDTVRLLKERDLEDEFVVFIGGGAITPKYAKEIGAHYGGDHAEEAVRKMFRAMKGEYSNG